MDNDVLAKTIHEAKKCVDGVQFTVEQHWEKRLSAALLHQTAHLKELQDGESVLIPVNETQARLMVNMGIDYLERKTGKNLATAVAMALHNESQANA